MSEYLDPERSPARASRAEKWMDGVDCSPKERAALDSVIRAAAGLSADAQITRAATERIEELGLPIAVKRHGGRALAQFGEWFPNLRSLGCASREAFAEVVQPASRLRSVQGLGGSITDEGIRALCAARAVMPDLQTLSLSAEHATDRGIEMLAMAQELCEGLIRVSVSVDRAASDVGLAALASPSCCLRSLTYLSVWDRPTRSSVPPPYTDAGLAYLAQPDAPFACLSSLDLHCRGLTDTGLANLARPGASFVNLVGLSVTASASVTDDGLMALAAPGSSLGKIRSLQIKVSGISSRGVGALARPGGGLIGVEHLHVGFGDLVDDAVLEALARPDSSMRRIKSLSVRPPRVTARGIAALAQPTSGLADLEGLSAEGLITDDLFHLLCRPDSGVRSLRSLGADWSPITDEGLLALAQPDAGLRALRSLSAEYTSVTAAAVEAVRRVRPELRISID